MEEKNKEQTGQISQISQEKPGGNTKTPGFPPHQLYRWCVTLPYEECSASQLCNLLREIGAKKFTFQAEKGEESDYKHWQIELTLENKVYFNTFKNMLGFDKAHIEGTKNYFKAKNYCSKTETRIEGPYTEKSKFLKIIENLYDWQIELRDICLKKDTDDRKIIWVWDKDGNNGKTQFSKYMAIRHNATILQNAATKDIAYAIPEEPEIIIFNLPRTLENRTNYTAIESVKDGLLFSAKYESRSRLFNSPHVIIFANFGPNMEALTVDKWDIRKIVNKKLEKVVENKTTKTLIQLNYDSDNSI